MQVKCIRTVGVIAVLVDQIDGLVLELFGGRQLSPPDVRNVGMLLEGDRQVGGVGDGELLFGEHAFGLEGAGELSSGGDGYMAVLEGVRHAEGEVFIGEDRDVALFYPADGRGWAVGGVVICDLLFAVSYQNDFSILGICGDAVFSLTWLSHDDVTSEFWDDSHSAQVQAELLGVEPRVEDEVVEDAIVEVVDMC